MSETSLMSVCEMIDEAFGDTEKNTVNMKMLEAVIFVLADKLKFLQRRVMVELGHPYYLRPAYEFLLSEVKVHARVPRKARMRRNQTDSSREEPATGGHRKTAREKRKDSKSKRQVYHTTVQHSFFDKQPPDTQKKVLFKQPNEPKKGVKRAKQKGQKDIASDSSAGESSSAYLYSKSLITLKRDVLGLSPDSSTENLESSYAAWLEQNEIVHENLIIVQLVRKATSGFDTGTDYEDRRRPSTIVTTEQFEKLVQAVIELQRIYGSNAVKIPGLTDNPQFMKALHESAPLSEGIAGLQLSARLETAEMILKKMMDVVTEIFKALKKDGDSDTSWDSIYNSSATSVASTDKPKATADTSTKTSVKSQPQSTTQAPPAKPSATKQELTPVKPSVTTQEVTPAKPSATKQALAPVKPSVTTQEVTPAKPSATKQALILEQKEDTPVGPLVSRPALGPTLTQAQVADIGISRGQLNWITHEQMESALRQILDDYQRQIPNSMNKQIALANDALKISRNYEVETTKAMHFSIPFEDLELSFKEYAEAINTVDLEVSTQMTKYQEELTQMQGDLEEKLDVMAENLAKESSDVTAVAELNLRLTNLTTDIFDFYNDQKELTKNQTNFATEIQETNRLIQETLEAKCDRGEIAAMFEEKADSALFNGFEDLATFGAIQGELEKQIQFLYDKVNNTEVVWQKAITSVSKNFLDTADTVQVDTLMTDIGMNIKMLKSRIDAISEILDMNGPMDPNDLLHKYPCLSCEMAPDLTPIGTPTTTEWADEFKLKQKSKKSKKRGKRGGICYPGMEVPHTRDERSRTCSKICGGPPDTAAIAESAKYFHHEPLRAPVSAVSTEVTFSVSTVDNEIKKKPCKICNKVFEKKESIKAEAVCSGCLCQTNAAPLSPPTPTAVAFTFDPE